MEIAGIGVRAVGVAKAGTAGMAESGATSSAIGVAMSIAIFATTSDSSKVPAGRLIKVSHIFFFAIISYLKPYSLSPPSLTCSSLLPLVMLF